jgi:hypothetical protein
MLYTVYKALIQYLDEVIGIIRNLVSVALAENANLQMFSREPGG